MYYFKKMIEDAQRDGIVTMGLADTILHSREVQNGEIFAIDESPKTLSLFEESLKECQHFVFRSQGDLSAFGVGASNCQELGQMDAPFRVFSIEIGGKSLIGSLDMSGSGAPPLSYSCIMAVEYEPRRYLYFSNMGVIVENKWQHRVVCMTGLEDLVQPFIDRLNRSETGVQRVGLRIKVGSASKKEVVEIRKITYVSPTRYMPNSQSVSSAPIDWSHRWFVRGHWRKIEENALGKDRAGDYCVHGNTWVKEHEKGNPNKELIHKVRLV
jgi:hypothetical protein